MAGRLADEILVDFEIFKKFYTLQCLVFHIVNITAMLLIVLEVHFSWFYLNKEYFRVCFVGHKICLPFFLSIPSIRYWCT